MKDNFIMFDAVARVDDQLIDRCANRMLQKATADDNAEREVKKEMRFSMKKVIPFAACAIIAIIIGTVLFMDPLSVFNHVSNAPDKEYEATHVRFTNVEDAAREIGAGYLFDLFEDKEIKNEIVLGYTDGGSINNTSTWTDIDCYFEGKNETIVLYIYFPAYSKDEKVDHSNSNTRTILFGNTEVSYTEYDKDSGFVDNKYVSSASFDYNGNSYVLEYYSDTPSDAALDILAKFLSR